MEQVPGGPKKEIGDAGEHPIEGIPGDGNEYPS